MSPELTASLRCVCRGPAAASVSCYLLNDTVYVTIGVCDHHGPDTDDEALALVRALLLGVARAGNDLDLTPRAGGNRHDA